MFKKCKNIVIKLIKNYYQQKIKFKINLKNNNKNGNYFKITNYNKKINKTIKIIKLKQILSTNNYIINSLRKFKNKFYKLNHNFLIQIIKIIHMKTNH